MNYAQDWLFTNGNLNLKVGVNSVSVTVTRINIESLLKRKSTAIIISFLES